MISQQFRYLHKKLFRNTQCYVVYTLQVSYAYKEYKYTSLRNFSTLVCVEQLHNEFKQD